MCLDTIEHMCRTHGAFGGRRGMRLLLTERGEGGEEEVSMLNTRGPEMSRNVIGERRAVGSRPEQAAASRSSLCRKP